MPTIEPTSASAAPSTVPSSSDRTPSSATACSRRCVNSPTVGCSAFDALAGLVAGHGIDDQSAPWAACSSNVRRHAFVQQRRNFLLASRAQPPHVGPGFAGVAARKVTMHEAAAHQVARDRARQQHRAVHRLDAQPFVDRPVDAVAHRVEQRQRRGIAATRAGDEGGSRTRPVELGRSPRAKARHVPRLHRSRTCQHPVARGVDQPFARHNLIDRAAGECFGRSQPAAFEHQGKRRLDADQPRQALRAAAGRQQAEGHLDQADERLVVVDQHTMAAAQRELVAAAERDAVDGRGDRLAAALDAAQVDVPAVADARMPRARSCRGRAR